jgi:hypothetical protein
MADPFGPRLVGRNIPGMRAAATRAGESAAEAEHTRLAGRDRAVRTALELIFGSDRILVELGTAPTGRGLEELVGSRTKADIRSTKESRQSLMLAATESIRRRTCQRGSARKIWCTSCAISSEQ